jgi:hypothetical protein
MAWGLTPDKLGFKIGDVLVGLKSGTIDSPEAVQPTDGRLHTLSYLWNSSTLAWEVATTSGQGTDVFVTNLSGTDQAVRLDVASSTVTYVGKAVVGASTAAASWKVFRMTTASDGDLTIEYADGDADFDNVWDNRAGLSYT